MYSFIHMYSTYTRLVYQAAAPTAFLENLVLTLVSFCLYTIPCFRQSDRCVLEDEQSTAYMYEYVNA